MKIAVIGFGKVAKAIINNFTIDTCFVRDLSKIDKSDYSCAFVDSYSDIPEAQLYIISVVDDAIENVVNSLQLHIKPNSIVAHTSGSISLDVVSSKFKNAVALYPLYPFANPLSIDFVNVPIFLESTNELSFGVASEFVNQKNCKVQQADSAFRAKIHISAVFTCNFVNHIASLSEEYLTNLGCDPKILDLLLKQTVDSILSRDCTISELQTGPALREDITIINKHIECLDTQTNMQNIYKTLTNSIITQKNGNKKL